MYSMFDVIEEISPDLDHDIRYTPTVVLRSSSSRRRPRHTCSEVVDQSTTNDSWSKATFRSLKFRDSLLNVHSSTSVVVGVVVVVAGDVLRTMYMSGFDHSNSRVLVDAARRHSR